MSSSTDAARADGLGRWLAARGFDVCAALPPARYDALVPPAWRSDRTGMRVAGVWLLGSSGAALWRALRAAPEWRDWRRARVPDPLDRYTERVGHEACERLRAAGCDASVVFAHQPRAGGFADFVGLAREAGLGAPGRLGLLLHPEYGPWLSLRLLLLTGRPMAVAAPDPRRALGAARAPDFAPCLGCPAPCADACHGGAVLPEGFSVSRCADARGRVEACRLRCDARHACVLGPSHAVDPAAEAYHMSFGGVPPARSRPPAG